MHFQGMTEVLPLLVSDRLIVRMAEHADRDQIISFFSENRAHLSPVEPIWPANFLSADYWDAQIAKNLDDFYSGINVRMFVFERGNPQGIIGAANLNNFVRGAGQFCHIGYSLAANKQGKGYMTEAVTMVVKYAFEELNFHRVRADYIPTNERSANVLRRAGFTVEGYARDLVRINGRWQDHILTSIINANWKD